MPDPRTTLMTVLDALSAELDSAQEILGDVTEAVQDGVDDGAFDQGVALAWDELSDRFDEFWGDFNTFWLEHADKVRHEREAS